MLPPTPNGVGFSAVDWMSEKKIADLLGKKRAFFEVILELTQTERSLMLCEYMSVLEQKKILLSCIDEIDEKLSSFKETLSSLSQEIHEEIEQIRAVVEEILHLDSQNQALRKTELKHAFPHS